MAAKILSTWLSGGNSVAALWIGSMNIRRFMEQDHVLGILAPSWSISALVRRYNIPVRRNPRLSSWTKAGASVQQLEADVLITAMTGQIVPANILSHFSHRAVNFHPAVLPHYRGPNPRSTMILDGNADLCGGITLHCLSCGVDKGDIIGVRKIPYDADRGFIYWDVCLARGAGDLVQKELPRYLSGTLTPSPQPANSGCYRKLRPGELTLSAEHSACRIKWLCDQFGTLNWLRFRPRRSKRYAVAQFIRQVGPRIFKAERITKFTIEFDAADARVRVRRHRRWTRRMLFVRCWLAIARTCGVFEKVRNRPVR
jgi:methionyl-tRNA formyltransferase